jgi:hypothetical protein
MIYQLDDRYLFRHIPGSRKLASPAGQAWPKVLVKINEFGRRGEESTLPAAGQRVVVYGDSFISAEYTRESDTYVAQLARFLAEGAGPTVVLNAGVTGYGVDQEVLLMEDQLPRLKPDLVVIAVFAGNDFGDLLRNKLFRLDATDRLVRNAPEISPELRRDFSDPFPFSSIQLVRLVHSFYQQWGPRPPASVNLGDSTTTRLANRVAEYEDYVVKGDNMVRNLLADE